MRVDARNKSSADFFRRHFVTPPTENVFSINVWKFNTILKYMRLVLTTHGL